MNQPPNPRPRTTPPEIEAEESAWWQTFAELEYRFAWVQTSAMQHILRGRYIREIIRATPKGGRILELGCGTGWLCRELARFGASEVWGIDFSPAQIALAEAQAKAGGYSDRVQFLCDDGTRHDPASGLFDCVVVHAFLHHLDKVEIQRILSSIPAMMKPDGVFVVFEPVRDEASRQKPSRWDAWQRWLADFASRGKRWGLRNHSEEEARWRALFARRTVGKYPHGPSPKEMPFAPGELDEYLRPCFAIDSKRICMAMSHLVVQEWLLRELSNPRSTRFLLPWVARAAAWMDARLVAQPDLPPGVWQFTMYVCRLIGPPPAGKDASRVTPASGPAMGPVP
jgi:SAM-dependent methyltransferase